MKQLVCEMCGSVDLLKQDGVYVCEACGTKYSVEEAKKLMIEGPIQIEGPVQVDHSNEIGPLLQRAFDLINEEEYGKAYEVCEKIFLIDPSNAKANLAALLAEEKVKDLYSLWVDQDSPKYKKIINSEDVETKRYVQEVCDYQKRAHLLWRLEPKGYMLCGYNGRDTSLTIPSDFKGKPVTSIDEGVFYNFTNLTSIIIPESVSNIGEGAFGRTNLTSIPNNVTSIGG